MVSQFSGYKRPLILTVNSFNWYINVQISICQYMSFRIFYGQEEGICKYDEEEVELKRNESNNSVKKMAEVTFR